MSGAALCYKLVVKKTKTKFTQVLTATVQPQYQKKKEKKEKDVMTLLYVLTRRSKRKSLVTPNYHKTVRTCSKTPKTPFPQRPKLTLKEPTSGLIMV